MKARLPAWLLKEISPRRKRSAPPPLPRKTNSILGWLVLLVAGAFVLWRLVLFVELRMQFARIRSSGLPTSGAELNAWLPAISEAENGALVLTQAFALLRTFPDSRSNEVAEPKLLGRHYRWSGSEHDLVGEYVNLNAEALGKAREALRFSRFRYPVDFSYGPETELPHLRPLKKLGQIAFLQAALGAEEGRTNEWPEKIEFGLQIASTLESEPTLVSHLAYNGLVRMAAKATERALNQANPGEPACAKLQGALTRLLATNSLPLALIGERAMVAPAFRLSWKEMNSFREDENEDRPPRKPQRYTGKPALALWLLGIFERDLSFYLKTMEKSISLAALTPPANQALTNHFENASTVAKRRVYLLSGLLLPALTRVAVREASTQAQMEAATTALAVERFRLAQGGLPTNLEELVPRFLETLPVDPFDGAALRYRPLRQGYVIYSVDADGHDDGGREGPERKKAFDKTTYDITFTVGR